MHTHRDMGGSWAESVAADPYHRWGTPEGVPGSAASARGDVMAASARRTERMNGNAEVCGGDHQRRLVRGGNLVES